MTGNALDRLHKRLKELYYAPGGFMGAKALLDRVTDDAKFKWVTMPDIRKWLESQQISSVHAGYSRNARKIVPHFTIDKPNDIHQLDIMYLVNDDGYKYILTLVDVASRFKAAAPLQEKSADAALEGLKAIYYRKGTPLKFPREIMVDDGSEFKGVFQEFLENRGIQIRRAAKYRHRAQAFVEAFNRELAKRLFKSMEHKGYEDEWLDELQATVDAMNQETTALTGMKPAEAIKLKSVPQPTLDKDKLAAVNKRKFAIGDWVRRLLERDETMDQRRRATDQTWSPGVYQIHKIVWTKKNPTLYYLTGPYAPSDDIPDELPQPSALKHGYTALQLKPVSVAKS